MSSITVLAKTLGGTLLKNAPGIMAGVGAAGLIATAVFAGQASIRAAEIIREDEEMVTVEDTREPMTVLKDRIKLVWKLYIPTIAMGALSIACIFGSHHVNVRRAAALSAALSLSENTLSKFQKEATKVLSDKKLQEVRDAVAESKAHDNPLVGNSNQILLTGNGDMLCYDTISGRYFKSNVEKLRSAENTINHNLVNGTWVDLNELYSEIGLPPTKLGHDLGWVPDNLVQLNFSSMLSDNGEPCLVMDYGVDPKYNPWR